MSSARGCEVPFSISFDRPKTSWQEYSLLRHFSLAYIAMQAIDLLASPVSIVSMSRETASSGIMVRFYRSVGISLIMSKWSVHTCRRLSGIWPFHGIPLSTKSCRSSFIPAVMGVNSPVMSYIRATCEWQCFRVKINGTSLASMVLGSLPRCLDAKLTSPTFN